MSKLLTKYSELEHNMKVTCILKDNFIIEDGKLSINHLGEVYVCQNKIKGFACGDFLGYEYSYKIADKDESLEDCFEQYEVTELKSIEEEESQEIESIEVIKPYKFSLWDKTLEELIKLNPDAFKINYKPKKPIVKYRPNGALVYAPELGKRVYFVDFCREVYHFDWQGTDSDLGFLYESNCFDSEEKAEIYGKKLKIYYKIRKKLEEINAENNWVADWSDLSQNKYYIFFDHQILAKACRLTQHQEGGLMWLCEQAKDYIMSDAVSLEDFKTFIEVSQNL